MNLLVCTQKVNKTDTTLGFFHAWILELSKKYTEVSVICLEKGEYDFPENVTVYSLGKEEKESTFQYVFRFYNYIVKFHDTYDSVFVHMNQEYVILGGWYWKLMGKKVYMWRNHPYGNIATRIAVMLSNTVFCTSEQSFTAQFKKTVIMPAGIDTKIFAPVKSVLRGKNSVCMVGRIAPVKGIGLCLEALKHLIESGIQVSLTVIGSPLPKDVRYYTALKQYVLEHSLSSYIQFEDAVSPESLPEVYSSHEICVNLTEDGSFDKTIVEAAGCGAIPIVSNGFLKGRLPDSCITERNAVAIAQSIERVLSGPIRVETSRKLEAFVSSQSLDSLVKKLTSEMH